MLLHRLIAHALCKKQHFETYGLQGVCNNRQDKGWTCTLPADARDWVETMARRFRCICRATAQVGREPQTPKWAETLTWLRGHVGKEASQEAIEDTK